VTAFYAPAPNRRGHSAKMLSDVCLFVAYIGPKSRTERPRKKKNFIYHKLIRQIIRHIAKISIINKLAQTDVRQTDVIHHHRLMPPPMGRGHNN